MTLSHNAQILSHLRKGRTLTAMEAMALFRCARLSARILDLKQLGNNIHAERIRLPSGKYVAQYSLIGGSDAKARG